MGAALHAEDAGKDTNSVLAKSNMYAGDVEYAVHVLRQNNLAAKAAKPDSIGLCRRHSVGVGEP